MLEQLVGPGAGAGGDGPGRSLAEARGLVDELAELKMIRSLQLRINKRTKRYARLLDDIDDPVGQAKDGDLQEALQKLAEREESIHRITREIVLGKNK